ncbi:MAG: hypothetical protein WHT65_04065 [Pseudothermotoga sp.]
MKRSLTLAVVVVMLLLLDTAVLGAAVSQDQIIQIIKERSAIARSIPDQAYKAALDSMKGTKPLKRLIEMAIKVKNFEELANTPVPTNFNDVNEFRKFKEIIKDKLNPLNWLLDIVTPKWISFISDTKEVFSAVRADILEKAFKESLYQKYKASRDLGNDMDTAYDEQTQTGGISIIRSSEEYKNLSEKQAHDLLKRAMEERYRAEKYAEFILELRANKNKYIADILRLYSDDINTLVETAKKLAEQTMINLTGSWTVTDSAGRFNGTMTLNHIDFTTVIGSMQTPGGKIDVYGTIGEKDIELQFHFHSESVINQYLQYPELSKYVASKGGTLATIVLKIADSVDSFSGTLYPWYVVFNDSEGSLVVKDIVYGTPEQSGTPRSISIARR